MSIVLDKSAMVAYSRGSKAVGELIILVTEEDDGVVALPMVALAEAYALTKDEDHAMLRLLAIGGATILAPLDPSTVARVGVTARSVSLGTAHALRVAVDFDRYLVTTDANAVAGLIEERLIIEI